MVPGWCRAEASTLGVKVVLMKAQPGAWETIGELCSAEAAGMTAEAETVESERQAEVEAEATAVAELEECPERDGDGPERKAKGKKLAFYPAKSFEGAKPGYVFQIGPDGLGYYQDIPAESKLAHPIKYEQEEDDGEEEPQTKWDWVQEARAGGATGPIKGKGVKPAFKRGFIDSAAASKKAEEVEDESSDPDGFVMPGLDGDSDEEIEDDEEQTSSQNAVDVAWAPSISLQTRAFLTTLD